LWAGAPEQGVQRVHLHPLQILIFEGKTIAILLAKIAFFETLHLPPSFRSGALDCGKWEFESSEIR